MDFSAVSGIFDKILKFLPTSPFFKAHKKYYSLYDTYNIFTTPG